jgi:hypothetical protein
MTHILTCSCEARGPAQMAARKTFQHKLSRLHTPDVMNNLICDSMDSWLARQPVTLPVWTGPNEPIHGALHHAFRAQAKIGWDQFFRRQIAKDWN